jgi:hypothetical protein
MPEMKTEYRYRQGVHGEHCIDRGFWTFQRLDTIAHACTEKDARRIVEELNNPFMKAGIDASPA